MLLASDTTPRPSIEVPRPSLVTSRRSGAEVVWLPEGRRRSSFEQHSHRTASASYHSRRVRKASRDLSLVVFAYGPRRRTEEAPRAKPAMKVRRPASPWRIITAWLALNAGRAKGAVTFRSRLWVVTSWS